MKVKKRPLLIAALLSSGFPVVSNCFNWATFKGFHTQLSVLFRRWLIENKGVSTLFLSLEKSGSGLTTKVAIDALLVDIELTASIVFPFLCFVSHWGEKKDNYQWCQEVEFLRCMNLISALHRACICAFAA